MSGPSVLERAVAEERAAYVATARRRIPGDADPEDAVQEALLRAWVRRQGLDGDDVPIGAWITGAIKNICREIGRRPSSSPLLAWDGPVEDPTDLRLSSSAIAEAVSTLPADQRQAVVGMYVDGHTAKELAAALGCSEDVIHQRARRGAAAMRHHLGFHGISRSSLAWVGALVLGVRRLARRLRDTAPSLSPALVLAAAVLGAVVAGGMPTERVGNPSMEAGEALVSGKPATALPVVGTRVPLKPNVSDLAQTPSPGDPLAPDLVPPRIEVNVEADGDGRVGVIATIEQWVPLLGQAGGSSHVEFYCDPDQPPSLVLDTACAVIRVIDDAQGIGTANDEDTVAGPTV